MSYIKKLTIQFEDNDGNVVSSDIEGVYVKQIDIHQPISHGFGFRDFYRDGPLEVTIKLEAWGDMWQGVRTQHDVTPKQKLITPPKQLPARIKQLPEHKDE